jgi:hypothetical protein
VIQGKPASAHLVRGTTRHHRLDFLFVLAHHPVPRGNRGVYFRVVDLKKQTASRTSPAVLFRHPVPGLADLHRFPRLRLRLARRKQSHRPVHRLVLIPRRAFHQVHLVPFTLGVRQVVTLVAVHG